MSVDTKERRWDLQSGSLSRLQRELGYSPNPYQPLPDNHPLLHTTPRPASLGDAPSYAPGHDHPVAAQAKSGYSSVTTPRPLPRLHTPPQHRHQKKVRTSRYPILPNVDNGHDSWGEEDDSDADYQPYVPYPVFMYPMVLPTGRYPKVSKKKRVHLRDTPTYLNSREHTLHEPLPIHDMYWDFDTQGPTRSDQLPYISAAYDPFDPRMNPILARYQYPVVDRQKSPIRNPPTPRRYISPVKGVAASDYVLEDMLEDVMMEVLSYGTREVVAEVLGDMAGEHLRRAAEYDAASEVLQEEILRMAPDIVLESLEELVLEDILNEHVIDPEVLAQSQEVAQEMVLRYGNKLRNREIREVKRLVADRLLDSLALSFLLGTLNRQGAMSTLQEHEDRYIDSLMTDILLRKIIDIDVARSKTIDNKPLRRYHEQLLTDLVERVLLEEMGLSLDEDMKDLHEYEQGLEHQSAQKFAELVDLAKGL